MFFSIFSFFPSCLKNSSDTIVDAVFSRILSTFGKFSSFPTLFKEAYPFLISSNILAMDKKLSSRSELLSERVL